MRVIGVNWGRFGTIHWFFLGGGRSRLHSQDRKTKKNSYKVRKGFHTVSTCILHKFIYYHSLYLFVLADACFVLYATAIWMSYVSLVTGSEGGGGSQTERGRLPETQGEDLRKTGQRRGKPTESDQIHPPQTTGTRKYWVLLPTACPPHPMYSYWDASILIPNHN